MHDNKAAVVTEREPFSISVHVRADRIVPVADVSIELMRMRDGVYVFWQSWGMDGANLRDLSGERTVLFRFDPNCSAPALISFLHTSPTDGICARTIHPPRSTAARSMP